MLAKIARRRQDNVGWKILTDRGTGVPADTLREFLKVNGVNTIGGFTDAKTSVVHVICVRK